MTTHKLPAATILVTVLGVVGYPDCGRRLVRLPDGRDVAIENFPWPTGETVEVYAWRVCAESNKAAG